MKIRTATISDLPIITAVEAECFPPAEAATRKIFEARLSVYPNHFWLLEYTGNLVGFINGMVTNEPSIRDEMFENAELHNEAGDWQIAGSGGLRPAPCSSFLTAVSSASEHLLHRLAFCQFVHELV